MSASTRTWSPRVRFAGKRPQSTCGVIPSIMTRLRPSDRFVVIAISRSARFSLSRVTGVFHLYLVQICEALLRLLLLDQALVQVNGLMRNRRPAENIFHAASACISKAFAFLGVLQQVVDPRREIPGELLRIARKARYRILIEGNKVTCFVVDNHLFDA